MKLQPDILLPGMVEVQNAEFEILAFRHLHELGSRVMAMAGAAVALSFNSLRYGVSQVVGES